MNTSPQARGHALPAAAWRCLFVLLALFSLLAPATAQTPARDFEHLRTGFALTGAHINERCESCHIGGLFKGTPRDCESCHAQGGRLARSNVVKSNRHVITTQPCQACHNTRSFDGARVDHAGMVRGSCLSCHNGSRAGGKSANHLATNAACDSCHSTGGWRQVNSFDHAGVAPGSCPSCHNGSQVGGKGASHPPYTQVAALASASCDSCHKAGFRAWTPARLHQSVNVAAQCSTCHLGARPLNATHAGQTVCETCHKGTSTWSGAKVDHGTLTAASNCASCHNGTGGVTGKNATHIPVGASNCFACHTPTATGWKPSRFDHTQVPVTAQCASCHSGGFAPADGKPGRHTPYQLVAALAGVNCDSCHKAGYSAWTPARLHAGVSVAAQCDTCHTDVRPANAVHTGQTACQNCHKGTSTWTGAKVDHATYNAATNCATCHNGTAGVTGKNATHIPVGATNCFSCHAPGAAGWKPTRFDHTQVPVTAQCATCHTGSFPPADGKTASHTPYTLVAAVAASNCDTCHKAGYAAWTPAKVHSSATIAAQCSTCHLSSRPTNATHSGQTVCETCHRSTTTWSGARVDHATLTAATNCATCHNGSGGVTGKNATHIPVGATNCYGCHSPTATTWKPSRFNHTQVAVTAQCASCHTGTFPPADGKGASHTPYPLVATTAAANCDACHKAGYASWTPAKVHSNATITAQCSTCHLSARPTNATHSGQTVCETCHRSTTTWSGARVDHATLTAATNCATCHNGTSGVTGKNATHIPVGATNCYGCHSPTATTWKPSRFNHTQVAVTAQCASCHTGTFPPADGKGASHTPYPLVAATAAANCDTCHKAGYASWTPAKVHSNATITAQCSTCHLSARPTNATHSGQTVCETCHRSTTTWSGARVDHATLTAATNCATCHNGTSGVTGKNATHIPVGATNCYGCHSPTATTWKPSRFNHTQVAVTAQCASCHTGTFPPADGKGAAHIPYQLITGASTANCDSCHKGGYSTWANGRLHANVSVTGQCKTCHSGTYASQGAVGKTGNHIPESQLLNGAAMECNACHRTTTGWTQTMNHNNSMGNGAGWCKACHASGTSFSGGMEKKSLTHERSSPMPTDCSQSGCHRPLGTKGAAYTKWD